MSSPVEQAIEWSKWLTAREASGSGDIDAAMRRLEARWGIPYSALWGLRYRPPSDVVASVYLRLQAAHEAMRAKQMRAVEHERAVTQAKSRAAQALVRAAAALARETD